MSDEKKEGPDKKVDESWKDTVTKEKGASPGGDASSMPEVTFGLFMSGLLMEALIALGDVEHPIAKKKEFSADHAKFIIETLAMIKDKTRNNLTKEEEGALDAILYDLRMKFVSKTGK